jgi:diguanylate cyclase (GGDEF)-like protein
METGADTWVTRRDQLATAKCHDACLVHIHPTGPGMGRRYPLTDVPFVIGRSPDRDIQADENSVSRHHARIQPAPDGYYAVDLESTNGTFVNDKAAAPTRLHDGDYLRVGNCIYRFLAGGNVEAQYHEEIYTLTIKDGLTDIHNKRYLLEFLDRELARSARYQRPLALVLFDIDRFKGINDRFGHLGGDHALRELVERVRTGIRREELFARYGGEEFAVVLPETTREKALTVAERIRGLVEVQPFQFEDKQFSLTVSVGVTATEGDESLTPQELLRQADERLYQAKSEGRNRVMA